MQKIADNNSIRITYHLRSKVGHKQRVDNCDWGWTVCSGIDCNYFGQSVVAGGSAL